MAWWYWCAALALAGAACALFSSGNAKKRVFTGKAGVVYLNVFARTQFAPSASPFCLKLESWLRLAGVPYEVMPVFEFSAKQKSPWVHFNGNAVADSALIIAHLSSQPQLNVTLDTHLTAAQRAVAHAFRVMCDEHTYWGLVATRWTANPRLTHYIGQCIPQVPAPLRGVLGRVLRYFVRKQMVGHGIGRHTHDEIWALTTRDLQAVADQLASHGGAYLMGDRPCSADASVFGLLAALLYAPYTSPLTEFASRNAVLKAYADRFRAAHWADWDEHLKPNGAKAFP